MKLRHAAWFALSGALLVVPPAVATPTGSSTVPTPQVAADFDPNLPQEAVPPPIAKNDVAVVPTTVTPGNVQGEPGEAQGEDAAALRPEAEDAEEAPPVVMPAAIHMPLPQINPFKPEVTLKAVIDLSRQRMTVTSGDAVLHDWPISSGRRGYFTPNGTYFPQWRARMWRSRQYYNAPMPYSVFFHRGYAVHGTNATGLLGRPASHGCIRLSNKNARAFYNLVGEHGMQSTQIVVQGKTKAGAPRVAKRSRSTRRRTVRRQRASRGYASYGNGSPPWWTW